MLQIDRGIDMVRGVATDLRPSVLEKMQMRTNAELTRYAIENRLADRVLGFVSLDPAQALWAIS